MFSGIVISIIILLIYYFLLIAGPKQPQSILNRDAGYQPFDFVMSKDGFIQTGGISWRIDLPANLYKWSDSRVQVVDVCDQQPDGVKIPADELAISQYGQRIYRHPKAAQMIKNHHRFELSRVFYFECRKDTIYKLFYCPDGSIFDPHSGDCITTGLCNNRPDGLKITIPDNLIHYYECRNGQEELKSCPWGKIFASHQCIDPPDKCMLLPDNEIYDWNEESYKICHNGVSHLQYCADNQFFYVPQKRCISKECKTKGTGYQPKYITKFNVTYAPSYYVCRQGRVVDKINCKPGANIDNDVDLPDHQVFDDQTQSCTDPVLGKNVFVDDDALAIVPGRKYRSTMVNYEHSHFLDHLYGYQGRTKRYLAPNRQINPETLREEPICDSQESKKLVILNTPGDYFDCSTQSVLSCPAQTPFFDYGSQSCYAMPNAHMDEYGRPLFRLDNLHNNWIAPRNLLADPPVVCQKSDVRLAHYNVCADPKCEKYTFLKQLPTRLILINDELQCKLSDDKQRIEAVPYSKHPWQKLNFWKQKLEGKPTSNDCTYRTRLESTDIILNKILWPTCNIKYPFILCPSSQTRSLTSHDTICSPQPSVFQLEVKANEPVQLFLGEVDAISSSDPTTQMEIDGLLTTNLNDYKQAILQIHDQFNLVSSKDIKIQLDKLPTNNVDYTLVNQQSKRKRWNSKINKAFTSNDEFQMVEYSLEEAISGLV